MNRQDSEKTKEQLIAELEALRAQVLTLQQAASSQTLLSKTNSLLKQEITERKYSVSLSEAGKGSAQAAGSTQAAQQRSKFLAEVSTVLASSLDYESTLSNVANLAVPYLADWCTVDIIGENQSICRLAIAHRDPSKVELAWELNRRYPQELNASRGVPRILRTGQAEIATEIPDEGLVAVAKDAEHLCLLRELGLRSCIVAPLIAHGRTLGAITFITAESGRCYDAADLSLAEDLAQRAAVALDNARLYREAQDAQQAAEQAADRTARLQAVTAALSESLTPPQVADVIVEQGMGVVGASSALVALLTESGTELEIVRAVGYEQDLVESWHLFPVDTPVPLAEAVRTGEPIWAETTAERAARYPHLVETYSRYNFRTWISIPLCVQGRAIGGLTLGFSESIKLSQDDRAFMLALTQQCAQAIERARLYEAERTARSAAEAANRIKDEFWRLSPTNSGHPLTRSWGGRTCSATASWMQRLRFVLLKLSSAMPSRRTSSLKICSMFRV